MSNRFDTGRSALGLPPVSYLKRTGHAFLLALQVRRTYKGCMAALPGFPAPLDATDRQLAAECCAAYLAGDSAEVQRLTAVRLARLTAHTAPREADSTAAHCPAARRTA